MRFITMRAILAFLLFIGIMAASAQKRATAKIALGLKLGADHANITGGRVKSPARIVLVGGIWCQIKLSKHWSGEAEIIYIEKGTDGMSKNSTPKPGAYAVSLMYLEAPVLFQYHLKKFAIEFGPGLSVLFYQNETLYGAPVSNMTDQYPFTRKEFSFNLGCRYSLNERWSLGLRFTHSLLPVRKQLPDISKQVYNRVVALTAYRNFMAKKKKREIEE